MDELKDKIQKEYWDLVRSELEPYLKDLKKLPRTDFFTDEDDVKFIDSMVHQVLWRYTHDLLSPTMFSTCLSVFLNIPPMKTLDIVEKFSAVKQDTTKYVDANKLKDLKDDMEKAKEK